MSPRSIPVLRITILSGSSGKKEFTFTKPFCIGRDENCEIPLQDKCVSRTHAEVFLREGQWWIRDLSSANGTYVEGKRIDRFPLVRPAKIELGHEGPILLASIEAPSEADMTEIQKGSSVTEYIKQYFGGVTRENVGKQTLMIRQAFKRIQKKQKGKFYGIIGVIVILLLASGAMVVYQQKKLREIQKLAVESFYTMKTFELEISRLKAARDSDIQAQAEIDGSRKKLTEAQIRYDQFVEKLDVYKKSMSEEDRIIFRMARVFGECDANLPPLFVQEVKKYIHRWTTKGKSDYMMAVIRAKEKGYVAEIKRRLMEKGLPPQFLYLALQESKLDINACGEWTRYGYAKGMWQFIPDTAVFYGLKLGPLQEFQKPDPLDERHNFEKATDAAGNYIRDIYDRDAQASGLLVMACYNWSETTVRTLISKLDENPRDRNFWALLENYVGKIPKQTYDYVFRIFSAAVIGENPRHFNIDLDNPLSPGTQ